MTDGVEITELAPFCVEGRLVYTATFDPSAGPRRLTGTVEDPAPPERTEISEIILEKTTAAAAEPVRAGPIIVETGTVKTGTVKTGAVEPVATAAEIALTIETERALECEPVAPPVRITARVSSSVTPLRRTTLSSSPLAALFLFGIVAGLVTVLAFARASRE